jgi:hypothetical protein
METHIGGLPMIEMTSWKLVEKQGRGGENKSNRVKAITIMVRIWMRSFRSLGARCRTSGGEGVGKRGGNADARIAESRARIIIISRGQGSTLWVNHIILVAHP